MKKIDNSTSPACKAYRSTPRYSSSDWARAAARPRQTFSGWRNAAERTLGPLSGMRSAAADAAGQSLVSSFGQGRWRPLIVTAIFTGLRASELRGLRWSDVDLQERVVHVRQRADRYNSTGSPKSEAGHRAVAMPPIVLNTLREWKRGRD